VADIKDEDWFRVKNSVEDLVKEIKGNGRPGLETRLRSYVDERDAHKEANSEQSILDLQHLMDSKHSENKLVQNDHGLKLGNLIATMNRIEGGYALAKVMAAFIAFMVTAIFALLMYLATTRKQAGLAKTGNSNVATYHAGRD